MTLTEAAKRLSNDEFEAFHAQLHVTAVADCDVCRLSTIQLSAALHATRTTRYVPPRTSDNPWERGVTGEHRPDETFMPYVGVDGTPIGVKQYANKRGHLDTALADSQAARAKRKR